MCLLRDWENKDKNMANYHQKGSHNKAPVGVFEANGKIDLILKTLGKNTQFEIESSADGLTFKTGDEQIKFKNKILKEQEIDNIRVSVWEDKYVACYLQKTGNSKNLFSSVSTDKKVFEHINAIDHITEAGSIVPNFKIQNNYVLFYGGDYLRLAYSKNLTDWEIVNNKLHSEPKDFFGKSSLIVANVSLTHQGILVFYWENRGANKYSHYVLRAILVDIRNPEHVLEKFDEPIWETPPQWANHKIIPVGVVKLENKLLSYWKIFGKGLFVITHPFVDTVTKIKQNVPYVIINKLKKNPLLAPIVNNFWESKATFNPAAIHEKNRVHIIYRAIGEDDVSVLGYASSSNGIHFDVRHPEPIYTPRESFELSGPYRPKSRYSPFMSGGGGYGGIEDPRITKIDDKLYMTYVAYNGWNTPRVALTSIDEVSFHNKDWAWEKPVLISKPNEVNKNACILPEKINGKYVIFHRVYPNILIDFVDSLAFDGKTFLKGEHKIEPLHDKWDSRKIGVGPPPIKTPEGWLMIYQAVGNQDPERYKIGAMLLDLKDPTNILYRTHAPILEPDQWYENDGFKAGVAYPCGAVVIGKKLIVYYGASDSYVCGATANFDQFVNDIKLNHPVYLNPISKIN
ncbi:hypothetical protein A3E11_01765 [Candidatus Curtissbacteria bacterium RIFCSPHIGHO2_12_FULL_38_37]|nr:MAG: hypothetical protein A3E11_01765 [Candidatus Curtissbacteria bacterium RIFCSPHIGHO2_12_FULL_38_37]